MRSIFSSKVLAFTILLGLSVPAQAQEQTPEPSQNPGSEQQVIATAHPFGIELGGGFMVYPSTGPVGNLRLSYAIMPELELALQGGVLSRLSSQNNAQTGISGYGALDGRLYLTGQTSTWRPFFSLSAGLMSPGSLGWPLPYVAAGGGVLWQINEQFGLLGTLDTILSARLALRYSF